MSESNTRAEIVEVMARAAYEAWPEYDSGEAVDGFQVTPAGPVPWSYILEMDLDGTYRDAAAFILTALEASGRAVVPSWQPIESAPKDGTVIDLWLGNDEAPHRRTDCYWGRPHHECGEYGSYCDNCPPDRDMWVDPLSMGYEDLSPTHWMPAALPPSKE